MTQGWRSMVPRTTALPAVRPAKTEITEIRRTELELPRGRVGTIIESRSQEIQVQGAKFEVDHEMLCAAIKHVTQTIGEYKRHNNAYATYVIPALRKARRDMVADLESHFGIHWEIDEQGRSRFFT